MQTLIERETEAATEAETKYAAEIASFTDTGTTIQHKGRTYAVLNPPADENRADSPWILRSKRGQYYALIRNRPNPKILFGMGLYGSCKCLPGWFRDNNGTLESCTP